MTTRRWYPALAFGIVMVGIVAVAMADEQYVIWRSSAVSGFDWEPTSGVYYSKEDCEQAIEGRKRRIGRALAFMRSIGADAALQSAIGDRVFECRPYVGPAQPDRFKGRSPESP
ncbi:MAG TPA: hypothetical protein VEH80_11655 [Candidatus Bathyarchaeia archaeon]|nr:hypothetical protein [Candidatus Bathyarchaeia archaeon]